MPHTGAPALLALAAGARHSLLLDGVGGVHACGGGASGQLGTGLGRDEARPVPLLSLRGEHICAAAAGAQHTLLLSRRGALYSPYPYPYPYP